MAMSLDDQKDAILREAAQRGAKTAVADVLGRAAAGVGQGADAGPRPADLLGFLRMYYRFVAPEDLAGREPERVATVALEQARLGAHRPQGRALVRVWGERGEAGAQGLQAGRVLIDIVTDDMPFLVDSVAMELNRHELGIHLLIHPQLRVRRDITGRLIEVCGRVNGHADEPDQHDEAWIHIAAGRSATPPPGLEDHLRRVLDDVAVVAEDAPRMAASAIQLADSPACSSRNRPRHLAP